MVKLSASIEAKHGVQISLTLFNLNQQFLYRGHSVNAQTHVFYCCTKHYVDMLEHKKRLSHELLHISAQF